MCTVMFGCALGKARRGDGAMTLQAVTLIMIVWFLMNLLFVAVRIFPLPE